MDADEFPFRTRPRWQRALAQVKIRCLAMVIQWQRRTSWFHAALKSIVFEQLRNNWLRSLDSDRMIRYRFRNFREP